MSFSNSVSILNWLTIQDCSNENYFENGITNAINIMLHKEAKKYIRNYSIMKKKMGNKIK